MRSSGNAQFAQTSEGSGGGRGVGGRCGHRVRADGRHDDRRFGNRPRDDDVGLGAHRQQQHGGLPQRNPDCPTGTTGNGGVGTRGTGDTATSGTKGASGMGASNGVQSNSIEGGKTTGVAGINGAGSGCPSDTDKAGGAQGTAGGSQGSKTR